LRGPEMGVPMIDQAPHQHIEPISPSLADAGAGTVVIAQLGQTLDGRIATLSGQSRDINGAAALDHLHGLRASADAVVVGIGTVIADDPLLTVRRIAGRHPARVIIDPNGRLPPRARCLAEDGVRRLVVTCKAVPPACGVEAIRLPATDGTIAPAAIIRALAERGFRRILIEGGAKTISTFIDAGCVDRLHVMVAPVILGSGKPALDMVPISQLNQALRPTTRIQVLADGNVLFDCDLRRTQP